MDYRRQCTYKILKDAMTELLAEKPLHKIKVTELCEKANMNRATFYNNFEDIYEFYETIENEFLEDSYRIVMRNETFNSPEEINSTFRRGLKYMFENKKLFMIFYRSDRYALLIEKMANAETEWISAMPDFGKWLNDGKIAFDSKEELQRMVLFAMNGIFGLLYNSFLYDKELDQKELSKLFQCFFNKRMLVK